MFVEWKITLNHKDDARSKFLENQTLVSSIQIDFTWFDPSLLLPSVKIV